MGEIVLSVLESDGKVNKHKVPRFLSVKETAEKIMPKEGRLCAAAFVNGKLKELGSVLDSDCEIKFIPIYSGIGRDMYKRSLSLLMLKSFSDVLLGNDNYMIKIMYSLGKGYFCRLISDEIETTDELLDKVKCRMKELVDNNVPIVKDIINTEEAARKFAKNGMKQKSTLFKYRRVSKTSLYKIENYEDYLYGYMLQSTGILELFDIKKYDDGFLLLMPSKDEMEQYFKGKYIDSETTKEIEEFSVSKDYVAPMKLYRVLRQADEWGTMLKVSSVGEMNDIIAEGRMNELILVQEALQEKSIGALAEQIIKEKKRIVLIAGPSSSGKTTFSHRLSIQLKAHGMNPHPVALDNYFVNRDKTPRDEFGKYDFECIEAMDLSQFNSDMGRLLQGETVEIPRFDFGKGERIYKGDFLTLEEGDVLICEGIHALNPKMSEALPNDSKFKIYISALTQLNIDEHNRIPTTDARLIRRIIRDARTRGNDAKATISMWESVRRGEEKNIFPYQEEADAMFNSALIYELAALKQYAEPLLFSVPRDCEEYYEAKRILKFLDYFLSMDTELVPRTSIIKEFTGGGCFDI